MSDSETEGRLHLFEGFGVEIEYAIADAESFDVRPISDRVLLDGDGNPTAEVERGEMAWSNELVLHVLELKGREPVPSLAGLSDRFHAEVVEMAALLEPHGGVLLPGGAHPWMDPAEETRLWPHEYREIYELYDRTFDCRRHGWANLQSSHLNLPFSGDEEFARLHAAVRLILPLLPALAASTPVLDGVVTPFRDTRLEVYRHNQAKLPLVTASVIPEAVYSEESYTEQIFEPLARLIAPFDEGGVMAPWVLNSRGAIARFDRGSIEIRLLDAQECPDADLAIQELVVASLRRIIEEEWSGLASQKGAEVGRLAPILFEAIRRGEDALIRDTRFLTHFGLQGSRVRAGRVWEHLATQVESDLSESARAAIGWILDHGTLATRMLGGVSAEPDRGELREMCRRLAASLAANRMLE